MKTVTLEMTDDQNNQLERILCDLNNDPEIEEKLSMPPLLRAVVWYGLRFFQAKIDKHGL